MEYMAFTLMAVAMFAALGIVFAGVIVMARGGEVNRKWGNRLMRYRIVAQASAIGLFALGFMLSKMQG